MKDKFQNKILSHEVSKFGRLDIVLHHKSTDFYEILDSHGLIDHLKNLDHLGFISKSHPGNNHKRWDYVMLQMYLLHKLKDEVFRTGLSSTHKVDGFEETTGIVILQVAVLFANIGHIKGTLASESELIHFLKKNTKKKNEFFEQIDKNPDWKDFANYILDNNDYYKAKYLIALNYLLQNVDDLFIKKIILIFFKNSIIEDEPTLRKLKWIFHKVRQISFVYLDSFNSDFPFQIDISKILLNIFNYKSLFNPNSFDFESFFDSAETTLTKKLYISPSSSEALDVNSRNFNQYLKEQISNQGRQKLVFNNFLISLLSKETEPFEISPPNGDKCFQFYLSKEDIEILGIRWTLFNYDEAVLSNYNEKDDFESLLNRNLTNKDHKVCLMHDGRKTMFFNNLIINQKKIVASEQNHFLLNYFNLHLKLIDKFVYTSSFDSLKANATIVFHKHYIRKIFLQLIRIMFNNEHELSAYIKFDNHQLISELIKENSELHVSGHVTSKTNFNTYLNTLISHPRNPENIKNNQKIAKYIIKHKTEIKKNLNIFYCSFPVVIDKYTLDPAKLYDQQNPESAETLTDIDMLMVVFNSSKFEFYIIEGKNKSKGFSAATKADFNKKIKPYLLHPEMMPEINIVDYKGAKGGYLCYKN